ncbi:MAG: hypothetical protein PHN39_01625 [Candidatus Pacebacteria bacterium]|nr:hypothetical protein [Candidatus Paceibacterota bacterium]
MVKDKISYILTVLGYILIIYSALLLLLNRVWLNTGNVYGPSGYFMMRGDWRGYNVSTYGSMAGLILGAVFLIIVFLRGKK